MPLRYQEPLQAAFNVHPVLWLESRPMPNQRNSKIHIQNLLTQFEQTQRLPYAQIRAEQEAMLNELLAYTREHVPYYRQALRKLPQSNVSLDCWQEFPLLTRFNVQEAGAELHNSVFADHGAVPSYTSGSTGAAVMTLATPLTQVYWKAMTLRDHQWQRRDLSCKLAGIRYFSNGIARPPMGTHSDTWGPATKGLRKTGPSSMLSIFSTTEQQAEWLQREDPMYLITYPTALESLLGYWKQQGFRPLRSLREVRTFGEIVEPALRIQVREVWGTPLVDVYSSQEAGYIALQCPDNPHYHVMAEDLIVEVINDEGNPCEPGEIGRVVITTLHNFASPLLRYEIGDYAEVGEPCPCGRGLPVLKRIYGRKRNMFVLPNGDRVWPSFEYEAGSGMEDIPIRQFQVVQRDTEQVDVYLVTLRKLTKHETELVARSLYYGLRHPFQLTFHYVHEIPKSPSGKCEDFRSEVSLN